jgi:FkbM family methyltransferase
MLNETTYGVLQAAAGAWDVRSGSWSEHEIPLLPRIVDQGDVAIDLGGNYAQYAYHLSRLVGPTGHVYSFEPVPFTARTFRRIAWLLRLKNVTLTEAGAGDTPGRVLFTVPVQAGGASAAGQAHVRGRNDERPGKERHHRYSATREVECEIVRVDDIVPASAEVAFIKADVEGAELPAFRGAQQTIDRCRPIVLCEINAWFLKGFGVEIAELTSFFAARGYQAYRYDEHARRIVPAKFSDETEDNFLFVHPARTARLGSLIGGAE